MCRNNSDCQAMARKKVWKDALHKGTWVTTKGQVFDCADDDLKHFHDRTKAMIACGQRPVWCWEHQQTSDDDAQLSAQDLVTQWAKNTGGHIHDVRLPCPQGPLEVLMDVDDEVKDKDGKTDVQKLEAIKFVSPDIRYNWRDRNGPESDEIGPYWPGQSFAHIAVTPLPVQYPQNAFDFSKIGKAELDGTRVSLSAAREHIALSAAVQLAAGSDMSAISKSMDASNHAWDSGKKAMEASMKAHGSGEAEHHRLASNAHQNAHMAHYEAADAHRKSGSLGHAEAHEQSAAYHSGMATQHDKHVKAGGLSYSGTSLSAGDTTIRLDAAEHGGRVHPSQQAHESTEAAYEATAKAHKLDTPAAHEKAREAHDLAAEHHKAAEVVHADERNHGSAAHHAGSGAYHGTMAAYHEKMAKGMAGKPKVQMSAGAPTAHDASTSAHESSNRAWDATMKADKSKSPEHHAAAATMHQQASKQHASAAATHRSTNLESGSQDARMHDEMSKHHANQATWHGNQGGVQMSATCGYSAAAEKAHAASAKAHAMSSKATDGPGHAAAFSAHHEANQLHKSAERAAHLAGNKLSARDHRKKADEHDAMMTKHVEGELSDMNHDMKVKPVAMSAADKDKDKKDDAMPFDKKDNKGKETDATADAGKAGEETPADEADPDISEEPEEAAGGAATPPGPPATTTPAEGEGETGDKGAEEGPDADAAQAMMELEHHMADMGVEFHGSAHDTLLNFVQHLNTAIATHKATKAGQAGEDENLNEQDQNQNQDQQTNSQNPQEPEVAESPPIMMSAATTKPTAREVALAKKLVKSSNDNLRARIANLHQGGYIDDGIRKELTDELGSIRLSMSDLTEAGDLEPTTVSIRVEAYERIAKTKKPGTFAKPRASSPGQPGKVNPLKPISSAVALSAGADEEIVEPTDADSPDRDQDDRPLNEAVVNHISGGRYAAYKEKMNGAAN
ncbi:MAG: hypothetical protein ACHP7J_00060 [Terriglobales bacterium]